MTGSQVAVLEHTRQQTRLWLDRLVDEHHFRDRQQAYSAMRAALHALRDRLTPEQAAHLGAQLPTLVRGIYYEGWHLAGTPTRERQTDDFAAHIARELPPRFPRDPLGVAEAVFTVVATEIDAGEVAEIARALPAPIRELWPTATA